MSEQDADDWPVKAYKNTGFLKRREARTMRILSEYLEPESRFEDFNVSDTIVFFGSARMLPRREARAALKEARESGDAARVSNAQRDLSMARYYEEARELAKRLTKWSKGLEKGRRRFVVCTGGGPGLMEAANRGASEARGLNIGLNISLPHEQSDNPYISRELNFEFNYFFMRKFWFTYLAKALIAFPGGFGTMDEFFELMTLIQTQKLSKKMPIVLYGASFWNEVINFDALVRYGTISADDLKLFKRLETVDEAFDYITGELNKAALKRPGGSL
ncbi:MAG: TIGR00730 family Rossman fold protein [Rhodospirillaceae bacterium]|nr:TIGR00730 family Rossman fold protein [Rhodospirillaceae bacterium]MBT5243575.1 TIGR00730 family Rossman fold protein [Rhodospirillaceae bacterium]MBT5562163.1 TIGR00730 family Rossman fold protein [Rhodospirillaceae bacterium]MBT6242336.1 TIGR00730 family Rossman fold protein [Rhodospirillaceae bacterium]MBT7138958.1 TIGR00730 family Rossman fold protein [Rhodospirillaceae bacterium]